VNFQLPARVTFLLQHGARDIGWQMYEQRPKKGCRFLGLDMFRFIQTKVGGVVIIRTMALCVYKPEYQKANPKALKTTHPLTRLAVILVDRYLHSRDGVYKSS